MGVFRHLQPQPKAFAHKDQAVLGRIGHYLIPLGIEHPHCQRGALDHQPQASRRDIDPGRGLAHRQRHAGLTHLGGYRPGRILRQAVLTTANAQDVRPNGRHLDLQAPFLQHVALGDRPATPRRQVAGGRGQGSRGCQRGTQADHQPETGQCPK